MSELNSKLYKLLTYIVTVYGILILSVFPLYFENNYINILEAKVRFLKISGTIFMIVILTLVLLSAERVNVGKRDFFLLTFLLSTVCSVLVSDFKSEAFLGQKGRMLGGYVVVLCLVICFFVSRYFILKIQWFYLFMFSNAIVFLLGVLNYFQIDPLRMYENLIESQHTIFYSTIGNTNFLSSYICLIVPVMMGVFYTTKRRMLFFLSIPFLVLVFFCTFAMKSDSWILGIGGAFVVFFLFAFQSVLYMRRFIILVGTFLVSCILAKLFIYPDISMNLDTSLAELIIYGVRAHFFFQWEIITFEILLVLFLICYSRLAKKEKVFVWLRRIVYGIFIMAALLVLIRYAEYTIMIASGDRFGSGRGYIFRTTWQRFLDLPLKNKIFGYGMNGYSRWINNNTLTEVIDFQYRNFIDAHNDFLQVLITSGVFGVIGYFGFLLFSLYSFVKKLINSPVFLAGIAMIVSFLMQGAVNSVQVFTLPVLLVLLGVFENFYRREVNF